jgi:hypothetical protein
MHNIRGKADRACPDTLERLHRLLYGTREVVIVGMSFTTIAGIWMTPDSGGGPSGSRDEVAERRWSEGLSVCKVLPRSVISKKSVTVFWISSKQFTNAGSALRN